MRIRKIAVAGPYSAPTEQGRHDNLAAMNRAAAGIAALGHAPLIGMNAALNVLEQMPELDAEERYAVVMRISLATVEGCDALLLIGESPGANKERDLLLAQGKPVFTEWTALLDYLNQNE